MYTYLFFLKAKVRLSSIQKKNFHNILFIQNKWVEQLIFICFCFFLEMSNHKKHAYNRVGKWRINISEH